ncbi:MAG TPA: DegT/DnrJ/EryC1/StrS family aminotransferase [Pirellulales bacterium]|nr:DegT/DnrJ/EryC1/StrS family aminotransferase [Pirellulales bacterium]
MEWKVRYVDYPTQFRGLESEVLATIRSVLAGGDLMLRQQLRDFETHLAAFVGTQHAVGVSNCTDGLRLILQALGVGAGDEVITVSHTFVATAAAVHHCGAKVVLVDVGDDHLMDPDEAAQAVTPRTKAILTVHLNGRICDMRRIKLLAQRHDLLLIEDAAQALGARYAGVGAGAFGVAAAFSFYPAKLLGAYGDAGAVVTSNADLALRIARLRDHGRMPGGEIAEWGFNCRLDNLQAALLDLKLARLQRALTRRRELAAQYHELLVDVTSLKLPPPPAEGRHFDVYQNYEIEADERDQLVAHLQAQGIEIMKPWGGKGIHQFAALGLGHFSLPRTEAMFRRALMLPMHPELSNEQIEYVAREIKAFYSGRMVRNRAA